MRTPIDDFVRAYAAQDFERLHMPGHKGAGDAERYDITEVQGADSLYEASGIIAESEANASALFGVPTLYSTEGSSQCIRAMLYLAALCAAEENRPFRILAGRNAHKTFLSGAALLRGEIAWLTPAEGGNYLSCTPTPEEAEQAIVATQPSALYLTSPDYLGNVADVEGIARVCRRQGVLLLVDNAHGAYLRFLTPSRHPMDLGADLCCDSAHKTLPVLTGGAYLHLSPRLPESIRSRGKEAMALFGSTSPSYLILASLDRANRTLAEDYPRSLAALAERTARLRRVLAEQGYTLVGDEPAKLTLAPKGYGYRGDELAEALVRQGIVPEFSDPDHLVLMLTPVSDTARLEAALLAIPRRPALGDAPPAAVPVEPPALPASQCLLAPTLRLPVEACVGRIAADLTVGCPPAVPVVTLGERITEAHLPIFNYYGITHLRVLKPQE